MQAGGSTFAPKRGGDATTTSSEIVKTARRPLGWGTFAAKALATPKSTTRQTNAMDHWGKEIRLFLFIPRSTSN